MSETGKIVTTGNMEKFKDLLEQEYIKGLSISGKTITYTKGDGTTGTITTQDTNTTYTAGPGLSLSSTKFSNSAPVYFVKGTQTASTNAWTGALPTGVTAYADGLTINYYLPYAGTSSVATLNLGSLGAKNVYRGDSNSTVTTHFPAGSVIQLVYIASLNSNAGGWKATAYYDSTYSAMSASEATTGTATSSRVITAKVLNDKINEVVSANAYSLPAATSSTLGGVKVGSNITNSSGTISLTKENVTAALGYTPPTTDTNTDTKVTNTLATTTKAYVTGTTSSSTNTGTQVFDTGVYLSTTAGELVATKFTGALNGNANTATSATKATQDSAGQQINSTYIKGLSVSGKTVTYTKGDGTTGTITTQDTNTTYSAGAGLSLSSNKFANTAPIYFVKGTQTAATNAWTGALPSGITAYADGLTINYYLPYAGTSTAATLNLGSLGAKNVYQGNGTGSVTTHYPAGSVIQLVYIASLNSNAGGWKAIAYYNSNTTNTAGATNTSSKIFLVGATSQAASPQTYTHDTAYVGTDGCLYSNNTKVSVEGHTHSYAPNYQYSTTDLEAGTSSLTTGKLYIVYE